MEPHESSRWLARVKHDLVKRMVWPARDLADTASPCTPPNIQLLRDGALDLRNDDGDTTDAVQLWQTLVRDAPGCVLPQALERFGLAVAHAQQAVLGVSPHEWHQTLCTLLALEQAFETLSQEARP